jgi:hypothetical protein
MYCDQCHLTFEPTFRFCEKCGQRLAKELPKVDQVDRLPSAWLGHPTGKKPNFDQFHEDTEEKDLDEDQPRSLAEFFSHEPIPKTKIVTRRM